MAAIQETERQVQELLSALHGMDFANRQSVRKAVENRLQQVLSLLAQGEHVSPTDDAAVRDARGHIAQCRQLVHACLPELEQLRAEWADRYRQELGDGKNEYEKRSAQLQQERSPEAYRWKRNFDEVQNTVERLGSLNGDLIDLSSQVEREHDRTLPPMKDTPPMDRTDRDPEMPANMS